MTSPSDEGLISGARRVLGATKKHSHVWVRFWDPLIKLINLKVLGFAKGAVEAKFVKLLSIQSERWTNHTVYFEGLLPRLKVLIAHGYAKDVAELLPTFEEFISDTHALTESLAKPDRVFDNSPQIQVAIRQLLVRGAGMTDALSNLVLVAKMAVDDIDVAARLSRQKAEFNSLMASYLEDEEFDPELMALADRAIGQANARAKALH